MWTAIERLQQGESLNVQDVKTNLFWEFGKFTSRDGESMESYYSRFYKLMNELTRNNLQVSQMQVNVQFLQQLQPEWSRFVTIVKQKEEIDTVSYHRLFDVLKQFQNEVNDIRSERLARSANPLALLAAAQPYSDNYYQAPKPQRSNAPSYMQSSSTRPSATTRHKGKEIAKPVTPQSESVSEEDSDPRTSWRERDMKKNLGTPWQFGNQRTMTVAGAREQSDSPVVKKWDTGEDDVCNKLNKVFTSAEQAEVSPEETSSTSQPLEQNKKPNVVPIVLVKPKRKANNLLQHPIRKSVASESTTQKSKSYYKELYENTNQEWKWWIAKRCPSGSNLSNSPCPLILLQDCTTHHSHCDSRMHKAHDGQSKRLCIFVENYLGMFIWEMIMFASNSWLWRLIKGMSGFNGLYYVEGLNHNLSRNASLTQELKECKTNLDESSRALGEATSSRDSSLIALQTKQTELEKYTALNDLTSDYKILQTKLNETLGLLALKDIDIKEGLKTKTYEISVVNQKHDELAKKSLLTRSQFEGQLKEKSKTIHMLAPKCATYHGRSTFANPKYLKKAQSDKPRLYEIPYDTSDPANRFCPDGEETVTLEKESRSKLDKDTVKPYESK
ncbi:hypothetical protein Tco_0554201 [Tanacetum coccineum]